LTERWQRGYIMQGALIFHLI